MARRFAASTLLLLFLFLALCLAPLCTCATVQELRARREWTRQFFSSDRIVPMGLTPDDYAALDQELKAIMGAEYTYSINLSLLEEDIETIAKDLHARLQATTYDTDMEQAVIESLAYLCFAKGFVSASLNTLVTSASFPRPALIPLTDPATNELVLLWREAQSVQHIEPRYVYFSPVDEGGPYRMCVSPMADTRWLEAEPVAMDPATKGTIQACRDKLLFFAWRDLFDTLFDQMDDGYLDGEDRLRELQRDLDAVFEPYKLRMTMLRQCDKDILRKYRFVKEESIKNNVVADPQDRKLSAAYAQFSKAMDASMKAVNDIVQDASLRMQAITQGKYDNAEPSKIAEAKAALQEASAKMAAINPAAKIQELEASITAIFKDREPLLKTKGVDLTPLQPPETKAQQPTKIDANTSTSTTDAKDWPMPYKIFGCLLGLAGLLTGALLFFKSRPGKPSGTGQTSQSLGQSSLELSSSLSQSASSASSMSHTNSRAVDRVKTGPAPFVPIRQDEDRYEKDRKVDVGMDNTFVPCIMALMTLLVLV